MGLFGKKGPTIGEEDENPAEQEIEEVKKDDGPKYKGNMEVELAKIHGQIDSIMEMRKATQERFSLITEQMGELRGMLTDLNQQFSKVEVSATKAIDKVDSVQPETFNTELKKNEGKIDALKANLESNETLMKDLMKEIKEMRHKMDLYKGTEQIINLHDEVKDELANTKKVEANMERHANRVETIFLDVEKRFSDFDKFNTQVKDINRSFAKLQSDFDKIRVKSDAKAEKKEFVDLVNKFNDFEKHTGNIIKLLDERSKHVKEDIKATFDQVKDQLGKKFGVKVEFKETKAAPAKKAKKKGLFGVFKRKKKEGEEGKEAAEEEKTDAAPELPADQPEEKAESGEEKKEESPAEGESAEEPAPQEGEAPAEPPAEAPSEGESAEQVPPEGEAPAEQTTETPAENEQPAPEQPADQPSAEQSAAPAEGQTPPAEEPPQDLPDDSHIQQEAGQPESPAEPPPIEEEQLPAEPAQPTENSEAPPPENSDQPAEPAASEDPKQ